MSNPGRAPNFCYVPGVTIKEFRKPKFAIWKVSKKHFLNLTKFIKNKIINYNKQWKIVFQSKKIVSEYDQEIPQSQTADNPVAL